MKYFNLVLALFIGFSPATAIRSDVAQDKPKAAKHHSVDYAPIISKLKEELPRLMDKSNVPGLAIAIVDGERLVWAEGFGYTNRSKQVKVTADTLFSLQSISKIYTATGFLRAVDKGWLKLDDPLRKYMPKFTVKSRFGREKAKKITFRHLLSHWSGLPHEAPCGNNYDDRDCPFADHVRSISDSWLKFPVGKYYSYSNLGPDLVGYVLQLRSGRPFEQFMKDEVFGPLEMTSSTFSQMEAAAHPSFALGHTRDKTLPVTPIPMIPSGGMYSTVKDMAKYVSFQLTGGRVNGKPIIRESLLKEMYTPQFAIEGQLGGYGIGIAMYQRRDGATVLNHGGGGYGYSAIQMWIPQYQLGVVVLTNSSEGGALTNTIANRASDLMIEAKTGSVPAIKTFRFTDKPTVSVSPELLRRLEGTYKPRGDLVSFKVQDGNLFYVAGNNAVKLDAHGPTEFTSRFRKFTFYLDESGNPIGVQDSTPSGVEFLVINDRPGDQVGANKPKWQKFVGEYSSELYRDIKTSVAIKNGYLYVSWGGGLQIKLTEYEPGLFFTADGEAVIFQGDRMSFGNRPFLKEGSTKP